MSLIFHCKTIIRKKNQQFHNDTALKRTTQGNDFLKASHVLVKIDHLIIIMPYQILTQLNGIRGNELREWAQELAKQQGKGGPDLPISEYIRHTKPHHSIENTIAFSVSI